MNMYYNTIFCRVCHVSNVLRVQGSDVMSTNPIYINAEVNPMLHPGRAQLMTHPPEKSSTERRLFEDDDDSAYCVPQWRVQNDIERGQGVGAEEERNHYQGAPANISPSGETLPRSAVPSYLYSSADSTPNSTGYQSLDDIPENLSSLSVEEVLQCLRLLNLHKFVEVFRTQQIDGELLTCVDQHVLVEEFGFKRFEAIKLEKFARNGWRPKMTSASPKDNHQYYYQQHQQQQDARIDLGSEPLYTDV